jgi:hypothetical protein
LHHGADINHKDMVIIHLYCISILMIWNINKCAGVADCLGTMLSCSFQNGGTALMYAVFGGFTEIVKKLLGLCV